MVCGRLPDAENAERSGKSCVGPKTARFFPLSRMNCNETSVSLYCSTVHDRSSSMAVDFSQINWLAVIVAGLVSFFIGGAWYSAIFQKVWVEHSRYSEEQMNAMKAVRPMPVFMGMMVVAY